MIKRIMCIGSRSAPADEKAKGWIIVIFMIIPALAGYFAVYSKVTYMVTPRNEGFYEITDSGFFALDTISICLLIVCACLVISAAYARNNYRVSTYLKETEKGYHEPIVSHSEPQIEEDEVYDFTIGVTGANGVTTYAPLPMTESQIVQALESMELTPNQVKLYKDEYKKSKMIASYLKRRKIRVNNQQLQNLGSIQQGEAVYLPV